jgi:flavorubredoxin
MNHTIIILYYSKSGNTKELAKRIFEILASFAPKNVKVQMMDATQIDINALKAASAYIIGSPDFFSYPSGYIKIFFDELYEYREQLKQKPAFGFITHGGTGKAVKELLELCKSIKLKVIPTFISVKEKDITAKIEKQILENCQIMINFLKAKEE